MMRLALLAMLVPAAASAAPKKLTIGLYAPSVELGAGGARLAYVQALGKAIAARTGLTVEARAYANLAALEKDKLDFAIVDAPCVVTHGAWRPLAVALVGGAATRPWALHASVGDRLAALRGKKLAYVTTGCSDAAFLDHAMFESELDAGFFAARVGRTDLTAAIAEVAAYRSAHAVFAPTGSAKGLTRIFDAGTVPNPAFVALPDAPAETVDDVAAAVLAFESTGAIGGWTRGSRDSYAGLAARMQKHAKQPVFALPLPAPLEPRDLFAEPVGKDAALVPVRQHFVRAPKRMQ